MPWISKARLKAIHQRVELAEGRAIDFMHSLCLAEGNIGKLQAELMEARDGWTAARAEAWRAQLSLRSHGAAAMRHKIQVLEVMLAKLSGKYKAKIKDLRARLDSQEALSAELRAELKARAELQEENEAASNVTIRHLAGNLAPCIKAWQVPGYRSDG